MLIGHKPELIHMIGDHSTSMQSGLRYSNDKLWQTEFIIAHTSYAPKCDINGGMLKATNYIANEEINKWTTTDLTK